jgi:RHS repeat-associated protein
MPRASKSRCPLIVRTFRDALRRWLRAGWFLRLSGPRVPTARPKFRLRTRPAVSRSRQVSLGLELCEDRAHPNDLFGLGALPLFGAGLAPLELTAAAPEGYSSTPLAYSAGSAAASLAGPGAPPDAPLSLRGANPLSWPSVSGSVSLAPSLTTQDAAQTRQGQQGLASADSLFGFPSADALFADPLGGSARPHLSGAGPAPLTNAAPATGGGGGAGGAGAAPAAGPQGTAGGAGGPQANAPGGGLTSPGAGGGGSLAQTAALSQAASPQGGPAVPAPVTGNGPAQNQTVQGPVAPPSPPPRAAPASPALTGTTQQLTPQQALVTAPATGPGGAAPGANGAAALAPIIATGADAGAAPLVKVFDASTGAEKFQFLAYDPSFRGGVRVASADLNHDGVPDIITAPGPGMAPEVKAFDGKTGQQLAGPVGDFLAYDATARSGLFVAAADVSGDGTADIVTAPDAGGGSQVKVFSGTDASLLSHFDAFGPGFQGGVRLAASYFTDKTHADVVAAAGPGGPPLVRVFDGATGTPVPGPLGSFLAYEPSFRGGVFVATGDVNGDSQADLITGAGPGHAPEVKVFDGTSGSLRQDYLAYGPLYQGGVRVASTYVDSLRDADVVTAQGAGGQSLVRVFSGASGQPLPPPGGGFPAYPPAGGAFVAAAIDPTVTVTISPSAQTVPLGSLAQVSVTATTDLPPPGSFTANITWGDGSGQGVGTNSTASHSYGRAGEYIVTVTATASGPAGTATGSATAFVTVTTNAPPENGATHECNCGDTNEPGSLGRWPRNGSGSQSGGPASDSGHKWARGGSAGSSGSPHMWRRGGGEAPSGYSAEPVRYADGVVRIAETDLHSDGFGFPWGQTRSWTNGPGYATGSDNGSGWVDTYTPHLLQADGSDNNSLLYVANGTDAYYYDFNGSAYQPRLDDLSQLTYNSGNDTFTLIDVQGDQLVFSGFASSRPAAQRGQFQSYTDANGVTMAVTSYTADGHVAETQRAATAGGQTVTESWLYGYLASGVNAGLLASVTLRTRVNSGSWSVVRQVQYAYYDGTQTYGGNTGDLLSATVLDGSSNVLDTSYYRYYTSGGSSGGYQHGLEYVFNPDSYDRLTAALGTNVSGLTDAQVAPYADNYFQYDSSQRVTLETAAGAGDSQTGGGLGTYTFHYAASGNVPGTDSWAMATAVGNPDGSSDTVYTNYALEVMLDDHLDPQSGLHTVQFYAYNALGQLVLAAAPQAVVRYDSNNADLLNNVNGSYQYLSNSGGLITRYDYYATKTAGETTAGGVPSYLADAQLQQGQQGTLVPQEGWQYYAHAFQGQTVAPLAADTVYRNTGGTGAETTSFSYTWVAGTALLASETDTAPAVAAAQNGPGTADVSTTFFDPFGNTQWVKDPDGYIQYFAYDTATGAAVTAIADVNTALTGEFTNLPSGWGTPAGGGLNLVTADVVDGLGRTTQETSPAGNVSYTVYLDALHQERVYPGWNAGTNTPTGPTEVVRYDTANSYVETLTMSAAPHLTGGVPDGTEAVGGVQTLSRAYMNAAGQVVAEDDYFNLSGLTYSAAPHIGALNSNYYEMAYAYDSGGRLARTQTGTGTIYRTVYDSFGEPVSDWVGTNDTPTSGEWSPTNNTGTANMVEVAGYQYDGGGAGDGNLTQVTQYPGGGAANRVTQLWYDWRDRPVAVKAGVQASESDGTNRPILYYSYDNLDEVTETQQYAGDGVTLSSSGGVPQPPAAALLRAQEVASYDEQGRVYQTQVYDVSPTTGAVGAYTLSTNYYYDHRGDLIATSNPGGLWTKSVYDGAGRDVLDYTTDGALGINWAAAASVANDTVLEQAQTVYDADSNVIETVDSQRFHNATGTGPLGSPSSGVGARVSYAAAYYDAADRLTASVDVGTNGGTAWTRPSVPPAPSDAVLVTGYAYNALGLVQDVTDPLGIDTRTLYDNLGRVTKTVRDYTGAAEGAENDVATEYGYDGDSNLTSVQADESGGAYQRTAYVYGVTTASGSGVNSNDILSAVQHPDPSTGNPSASQQDSYTVDALGEVLTATDRNGTAHTYSYDVLGRLTSDAVTTLGTGVDGSVRRIQYAYDSQGNQYLVTSYNAASGGSIVNQVQDVFNGLGQLTGEYQSHSGAVVIGTTPEVQYAYTEMSGGQNNSRLTSMTYPSGYALNYNYNTGLDSNISRLSSLSDSGGTLESYLYLGLGTVVERDHPQSHVNLTYIKQGNDPNANGDGGDQYTGLDRFGRVIDQNWYNTSTSTSTDRFQYGYDRDSDLLWRNNLVNAGFGELYAYDALNQLTSFQRGTLNGTHTGLVGSASRSQSWSPDALGNFTSVVTNGTTQTRAHNQQNEITSLSGAGTVSYDANGNTTADGSGNTYVYDAWDRLVAVKNGGTTLAAYGYNGLGERVTETHGSTTTDLYYSAGWQVLEERQGGQVQARNVWSPAGVDTLVLRDQSSLHNGTLDQRLYVQQDADGNVTALVGTTGGVLERYAYDPYGSVTVMSPGWSTLGASGYGAIYLWQGKRLDGSVGLYDSRGRVYSPTLMRPMQADPLGLGPDVNDYRWEGDGPVGAADPSGLDAYGSFWGKLSGSSSQSSGPGMTTDFFKAVPNNGNGGDLLGQVNSMMDARAAAMAQGGTPPPMFAGISPAYGSDGNRDAYSALYEAGPLIKDMSRFGMMPYYFTEYAGVVNAVEFADAVASGDYKRATIILVVPAVLRGLPWLVRAGKSAVGRCGKAPQSGVRGYLRNLRSYWERSTGGLTQEEAVAATRREGFGFEVGRQSRFENARSSVVIGRGNLQEGMVNRMELAEEIQHGIDGATHEASRAIRRGLSNEEFHAELFERIIARHRAGGHQFLTPDDIKAFQQAIKELRGR